jgi:hypothetical protein
MHKIYGMFGMFLIVGALTGLDVYVLTRAQSLSMLAEGELRRIAGDVLEWDRISATIDNAVALQGTVTLDGVRGFPLARRLPPVQARRARIHLRSGYPEKFVLEEVQGIISDELFDELWASRPGSRSGTSFRTPRGCRRSPSTGAASSSGSRRSSRTRGRRTSRSAT